MELIRGRERDCGQKYLVRLSGEERERLESLVRASEQETPAQLLTKAGILLKALGWTTAAPPLFVVSRRHDISPPPKESPLPARRGRRSYPFEESRRRYIGPRADAREWPLFAHSGRLEST
jgi:hypothetical protein